MRGVGVLLLIPSYSEVKKLSHPHVLKTGEEVLGSIRVLHQRVVVSQKLSFLKRDYVISCFNPKLHMQDTVIQSLHHTGKCWFWKGPPWSLNCYLSERQISLEEEGGGKREELYVF